MTGPRQEAVDHPAHYGGENNPYEAIKVIEAWGLDEDFYLGNAVKYIARAGKKAPKPRPATLTFIDRWARDRGITFGGIDDLPIINAHAAARGLPAFEVAA